MIIKYVPYKVGFYLSYVVLIFWGLLCLNDKCMQLCAILVIFLFKYMKERLVC